MINNIKILDCTLRDGGYINNWNFGLDKSKIVLELLYKANLDYIEIGFITKDKSTSNQTLFDSFDKIKTFLPINCKKENLVGMITFGKFPIEDVPNCNDSPIDVIRVIFKKNQKNKALDYCKKIKEKGYKLFINPTFIDQYNDYELLELINEVNKIIPYGFSIVDSMGTLKEIDLLRLYYIISNNLNRNIAIGFHSHNNLQLSFSNAQCLMKICKDRELIIDSTVFGMGRGAGNLCTELITQYINDNYEGNYNIVHILKIVDEQVDPIFAQNPWGYSVPYYLAAINHCHPNYAKYLVDKQTVPVEMVNDILKKLPDSQKATYDVDLIKQLYLDKFSKSVSDIEIVKWLKDKLLNKKILILAPGKSIEIEKENINKFIQLNNPFIVSLNFYPEIYDSNLIFVSNIKRFSSLENIETSLMVTSNIENYPQNAMVINYSTYLSNSKIYDNVFLIFLNLLISMSVKNIYVAGLDGFSSINNENYYNNTLINSAREREFGERNQIMSQELQKLSNKININFITKTKYNMQEIL